MAHGGQKSGVSAGKRLASKNKHYTSLPQHKSTLN
jgi:hypothetical protein